MPAVVRVSICAGVTRRPKPRPHRIASFAAAFKLRGLPQLLLSQRIVPLGLFALLVPLLRRDSSLGVIECRDKAGGGRFTADDQAALESVSEEMAVIWHRNRIAAIR